MKNTWISWMRAHKRIGIMVLISIIIWISLMAISNYLQTILRLDNQDLNEVFFYLKGKETIDITQGELLDTLYNCTLMQYDADKPLEHIVFYTDGEEDLFEGKYFELDNFYDFQKLVLCGFSVNIENQNLTDSIRMKKFGNFMVDYGTFMSQYDLLKIPTNKTFHMVSYNKNSLRTAMNEFEKYGDDYGYSYKQLDLKIIKTSDFLNKFKWTYLMFFSMIFCLQVIDIGNAYMYISSLKKVQSIYNLLGIMGYKKNIFMLFGLMKLIPLLIGEIVALLTRQKIMAYSIFAFYFIESLIIAVIINKKFHNK